MRLGALLVCAVGCMACVQPSVVHCADGRTCPAGTVCADPGLCALPVQLTACDGLTEGTPCSFPGATGACFGGVCIPVGCGNGIREVGEACDDGNTESGDGCSSDCRSNEACGDGQTNASVGEECDDGNRLDHDGCTSGCLRETGAWTRIAHGPPPARRGAAITYDAVRDRVVLFGGVAPGNQYFDDTWEWDGVRWTRADPLLSPPARAFAAMAFDAASGRIVMFGGLSSGALADTWEYLGSTWRRVAVAAPPSARHSHALAYDGVRDRVVMVGGAGAASALDDVYAFTGTTWEPLPSLPRPSQDHALAFDPVRGELVLFSGRSATTSAPLDDAWALGASGWRALPASGAPRSHASAAFDARNGRLVVFGGTPTGTTPSAVNTLTVWDGAAWSNVPLTGAPSPRISAAVTYDLAPGALVVFGGYLADFGYSDETFTLETTWQAHAPPVAIQSTELSGTWDPTRARGVLVSPGSTGQPMQTWLWNGGPIATPPSGPTSRYGAMLVWDRDDAVFAGGRSPWQPTDVDDTWRWNDGWSPITTGEPFPRNDTALARDRGGIVLHGGQRMTALGDTWTLRGTTWSLATSGPPARFAHAMTYDPVRERTVLFGGRSANGMPPLGDTWEWDGATWSEVSPTTPPIARAYHRMVYDPQRRRVVSLGSQNPGLDLTEWDGASWEVVPVTGPQPPFSADSTTVFYDAVHHGIVAIAGAAAGAEAWIWRYRARSAAETCNTTIDLDQDGLAGCDDPDCWWVCSPHCPPGATCDPQRPRCGDGTCAGVEDCRRCPGDCGACAAVCGDFVCDPGETCPGDC